MFHSDRWDTTAVSEWSMAMFHSLSSAVQKALAPDVPGVVDLRHQWNLFLRFYAENKPLGHKSQPVEKTNLVFHLNNMLKLLMQV